jgi:hypothetical protein
MDLTGIISVSGKSGLFKTLSQTKSHIIVESLVDGKRMPVHATQKVSSLEDISIYTMDEDKPLTEVFELLLKKENGKKSIDHKENDDTLKKHFLTVLENYDQERVYASDIKKFYQWYNILVDAKVLKLEEKKEKKEDKAEGEEGASTEKEATPKKKAAPKKAAAKADDKAAKPKKTAAKATKKPSTKAAASPKSSSKSKKNG